MKERKKYVILVVDDDQNILDMYSQSLAMVEYKVLCAHNGKEAWEIIKEHSKKEKKIDLVLLDIIMPKMDGFDVLEKIRKEKIDIIPVVMLTNLNRPEDMAEAKKNGAIDFLVKVKTSPAQLVCKVNQILKNE